MITNGDPEGRIFLSCEHPKAKAIRIYHECEGRIEKCVQRIIVWHQEACRVMTNGNPEVRDFSIMRTSKNTDYKNLSCV